MNSKKEAHSSLVLLRNKLLHQMQSKWDKEPLSNFAFILGVYTRPKIVEVSEISLKYYFN